MINAFLSRLAKVRQTGRGRWMACCPAHDDRTPSLVITEADDGRILAHCFAGCAIGDVAGAVGMSVSDLMPDAPKAQYARPMRIPASDVLKAMAFQATVVALAACDMGKGKVLSEAEKNKLLAIAGEFQQALEMVEGK